MNTIDNSDKPEKQPEDERCINQYDFPVAPMELEYLIEPSILFGRKYQFDNDVDWFVEHGKESDHEALAAFAERVRLSGDYPRYVIWSHKVDDVIEQIIDKHIPYTVDIPSDRRHDLLRLINETGDPPGMSDHWRESRLRMCVEEEDESEIAAQRREMRMNLITKANEIVHYMDMYFLFGLMDACDMKFE